MATTVTPPWPYFDLPQGTVVTILPGASYHRLGYAAATVWRGSPAPVVVKGAPTGRWLRVLHPATGEEFYVRADGLMVSQHET